MFDTEPLDIDNHGNEFKMNLIITVLQGALVVPYFFPMAVQLLFKLFVWPLDMIKFKGKCTFNLAYPQYKKQNQYVIASRRNNQNIDGYYLSEDTIYWLNNLDFELNVRINQVAAAALGAQAL